MSFNPNNPFTRIRQFCDFFLANRVRVRAVKKFTPEEVYQLLNLVRGREEQARDIITYANTHSKVSKLITIDDIRDAYNGPIKEYFDMEIVTKVLAD